VTCSDDDTVNTASRMESGGVPGSIQVTSSTYAIIEDAYVCEPGGHIPVTGKRDMETYLLISRRDGSLPGTGRPPVRPA
jgi:adenylate cyclase